MSEHKDLRNPFPTHDAGSAFGVAVTMGSRRTNEAISRRRRVGISVLSVDVLSCPARRANHRRPDRRPPVARRRRANHRRPDCAPPAAVSDAPPRNAP